MADRGLDRYPVRTLNAPSQLLVRCAPAGGPLAVSEFAALRSGLVDVRYGEGVIRAIEPSGTLPPRQGEEVRDLGGAYLCAGLVDAHVHLALGSADSASSTVSVRSGRNAATHLAHGITAVRDLGGGGDALAGDRSGPPRVVSCRGALTRRDAYGGFLGRSLDPGEDVAEAVRERIEAGANVIKVILTGSVDLETGLVASAHFTPGELESMVAAAHAGGLPVAVHANGASAIRSAVEAGADSIEHGILADEETVAVMTHHDVVWVPTLSPLHALAAGGRWPSLPGILERHGAMVARAHSNGVRVAAGTDAGSPGVSHGALLREVAYLRTLGFDPSEARDAAGRIGADLLGLGGGYGRLEVGAATDLVWFARDPFGDPIGGAASAETRDGRPVPPPLPVPLGILLAS